MHQEGDGKESVVADGSLACCVEGDRSGSSILLTNPDFSKTEVVKVKKGAQVER